MPDRSERETPLALTAGDPSGVGPEIVLAAWEMRERLSLPPFYVLSDPALLENRAARLGKTIAIETVEPQHAAGVFSRALPVVPLSERFVDSLGEPAAANAAGVIEAIRRGSTDAMSGTAAGLVTGPIAKKLLYDAGFDFPGHTEFLAHLAEERIGRPIRPVMMIAGPELRTVPVTIHIPLDQVTQTLTQLLIVETARITADDLKRRFGITAPRLAIAGLNPHAGEQGSIGHEDLEIIEPAVEELRRAGIDAFGPLPADTMFHARARSGYDVAICMYHDQALIPAKTLAFDDAVNVTLGLPFIRTSPDHGTAFDIAGDGIARPDSMIAAIRLARSLADNEQRPL